MKKKLVYLLWFISAGLSVSLPDLAFAHNLEKHGGSNADIKTLLQPDNDLSSWEHVLIYSINGLLLLSALILISMLILRKKTGKILVFFLLALAADYLIVLHYGSLLDLLG